MHNARMLCAAAILMCTSAAWAEAVQIVEIPSPRFTEAQQVSSEQWFLVDEIAGFSLPLAASTNTGSQRELLFTVAGEQYRIARADVVLANEALVTSACDTVPLALAADTRSASVKGAGESCR
ncbi:hypothetical protein HOP62_01870 [Halomonas sp. MCCC 1A17488]|uniref:hypothetical protein n=1 Tax=unclassified Halomonas TaxID=2609666 RepID=UPI0018D23597|nr:MULTISPECIES: hypothetical protein [unclassified Halomonas]MCE8014819.1 hypothetical protein [Halomonas sp. MCCC 1A17488]MCG3238152.1 hypothetical protein [Halomonas sp. MCCC 1A17488]QPP48080.1 hypothetical protein I4484_12530 [Halomonas sp. SS10-MC5]